MAPYKGTPTLAQQKTVAFASKFTGLLSFLGSSFIIFDIFRKHPNKRTTQQRLLIGMSLCDLISSAAYFTSTWAIPRGSPYVYGALGTQATCSAQGFFAQMSITTVFYNGSLALYYLLVIRHGWTDERISHCVEPLLHVTSISIGLISSLGPLILDQYNPLFWNCWISPHPSTCTESWKQKEGEEYEDCERGDNATIYQWIFFYIPLWIVIFFITISVTLMYLAVLKQEKVSDNYRIHDKRTILRRQSRKVFSQSVFYVGAFYITWVVSTIAKLFQLIHGMVHYEMILFVAISIPGQGCWNFLVYRGRRFKSVSLCLGGCFVSVGSVCKKILMCCGSSEEKVVTDPEESRRTSAARRLSSEGRTSVVVMIQEGCEEDEDVNENGLEEQ